MGTEPQTITLAQVVRRAAEIVDPDDSNAAVGDYERIFEDADEPISALTDLESRVGTVLSQLDPATASGTLSMLGALTTYLAYRRDEVNADDATLLRLAARAEWAGDPPDVVREWLDARGIKA